ARLRRARSDVAVGDMAMTMSAVAALLRTGAAPIVRRIPDSTALTFSSPVGVSKPAARWKYRMAASLRPHVLARFPRVAWSARKVRTDSPGARRALHPP